MLAVHLKGPRQVCFRVAPGLSRCRRDAVHERKVTVLVTCRTLFGSSTGFASMKSRHCRLAQLRA